LLAVKLIDAVRLDEAYQARAGTPFVAKSIATRERAA
jgi:hypothetical protein